MSKPQLVFPAPTLSGVNTRVLEAYDLLNAVQRLIQDQPLGGVLLPDNQLVVTELIGCVMRRLEHLAQLTE